MFCRRHRKATNERRRQMYTNVVAAAELYVESTLLNKRRSVIIARPQVLAENKKQEII